jgi:TPR repeat protein
LRLECLIDRHDISGGEDWKRRLGNLISEADTVVFVLSPGSARSPICDWEVEEATRLNKRILPVNCRPLEGASPPPRLRELNYVFFYEEPKVSGSGFGTGLASLVAALNTDFDWLREHTRYLQRAMEWDAGGRPRDRLLSGNDILEAKTWAARRPKSAPEPTALQFDFIRASEEEAEARLSERRKQLEAMAAAQAEREKALHEAEEALKQAADAQRRRVRIRNIALLVTGGLAAVAVLFALLANQQRITAEKERLATDEVLFRATTIIGKLQHQKDSETKDRVFALFQVGAEHGNPVFMNKLGDAYDSGEGVPQDYAKAREWYDKAAAKGHDGAMVGLGLLYENGQGVPQDYVKAREWFEKAAAKDNTDAMVNLGVIFENGKGVPQEILKRCRAQFAVSDGVLYRAMPEPVLNSARIVARIRQGVTAGVPQHVAMHLEGETGAVTDALYQPIHGVRREWSTALCSKYEGTVGKLPLQLPQGPQLVSPKRMNRWLAILCATNMQRCCPAKFHLRPFKIANLDCPKPVPVGD